MEQITRRRFFLSTLFAGIAAGARRLLGAERADGPPLQSTPPQAVAKSARPLIISSGNGVRALGRGMEMLKAGGDTLDAVLAVVNTVEDDPKDDSVGLGGLPNEDGDVELDACVMHGPTRRAGSVASIRQIKNPSKVARAVMERTNHVMLAGPGALRFAQAEGFEPMNLLTDRSRLAWLAWKAQTTKNWAPG